MRFWQDITISFLRAQKVYLILYRDLLDFVERDGVAGAVVEFGGPRAFMSGDLLSLFERPTIFEVGGDPSGSEGVVTNRCSDPPPVVVPLSTLVAGSMLASEVSRGDFFQDRVV